MRRVLDEIKAMKAKNAFLAVISLDIRGAFDHVYHHKVLGEMLESNVPKYLVAIIENYFKERKVAVATEIRGVDRGCPQGSVLGPVLWNVVYNIIVRLLKALGIVVFAFADDTLMLIPAQRTDELQAKIAVAIDALIEEYLKLGLNT